MKTLTVGQLARRAGLSRSTLLYYDSIGLLRPSRRTRSKYRLYDPWDCRRLEQICLYREAGLGLEQIAQILDSSSDEAVRVLERHLGELSRRLTRYREQQRVVVRLLRNRTKLEGVRVMDKQHWVALLRATGLDDEAMRRWHIEFERMAPEAHRDFLASLGVPGDEIDAIRGWAREY